MKTYPHTYHVGVFDFRKTIMRMIYLTKEFYEIYGNLPEMMAKEDRPYACLGIQIDNKTFAIPIRHNIKHRYCFHTINDSGLDYSKAVVIEDSSYISNTQPFIDTQEWKLIKAGQQTIYNGFKKYLSLYKHACKHPNIERNRMILQYSTLQHFKI